MCGEIRSSERFIPIIMGLGMRDNLAMQVACIQLVNALVSTPEDLDFRCHLRNEFMRTGLIDLISVSYFFVLVEELVELMLQFSYV